VTPSRRGATGPLSCGSTASSSTDPRICATPCTQHTSRTARAVSVCHHDCRGLLSAGLVGSFTAPTPLSCAGLLASSKNVSASCVCCHHQVFRWLCDIVHVVIGVTSAKGELLLCGAAQRLSKAWRMEQQRSSLQQMRQRSQSSKCRLWQMGPDTLSRFKLALQSQLCQRQNKTCAAKSSRFKACTNELRVLSLPPSMWQYTSILDYVIACRTTRLCTAL